MESTFMEFLKDSRTTIDMVRETYTKYPKLNGFMVEDLFSSGKIEILHFLASVDWFRMGGRDVFRSFEPSLLQPSQA